MSTKLEPSICPDCGRNSEFVLHEDGCPAFGREVEEFIEKHEAEIASWPESAKEAMNNLDAMHACLFGKNLKLRRVLEAVLLFHSASPWTEAKKTQWWNATQTNEATTRNLCDTVRVALGRLPSCFGDFTGKMPSELPPDMRLSHEQRNALEWITNEHAT